MVGLDLDQDEGWGLGVDWRLSDIEAHFLSGISQFLRRILFFWSCRVRACCLAESCFLGRRAGKY